MATTPPGRFIWYELITPDSAAAAAFYGAVIGWHHSPAPPGAPVPYSHFARSTGAAAGGVMELTPNMIAQGARPGWLPYLAVDAVPAAIAAIEAAGGHLIVPPMTIPEGTFALVSDPAGVVFYVMTPVPPPGSPDAVSHAFAPETMEAVCWNELASPDLAASRAFFAARFDFAFDETMSMGPLGDYCFIDHHGLRLGAMMATPEPGHGAQWTFYFGVPSARAAERTIVAHGGTVLRGAHPVPGGGWIVVARDPQGARFGVVGPEGE